MNNILIVDDEYISRNKIHFLLDYVQYGFNIVGEAENGKDALTFIEKNDVDVVFTDVYMPEMNGIELAEYINKHYPQISVVILSNYSEFEQVKRAFFSNVVDYLLKQTLSRETMVRLLDTLKKKHISKSENDKTFSENIQNETHYHSKVVSAILHDTKEFLPKNSLIAIIRIKNQELHTQLYSNEEIKILFQNISNIIAQIIKDIKGFVVFKNNENIVIYLPFSSEVSETEIMNIISKYIHQINYSVYKFFNFHLLWGISCLSTENYTIAQCYEEAKNMLNTAPSSSQKLSPEAEITTNKITVEQEKKLLAALSQLDRQKVNVCLEDIFKTVNINYSIDTIINELVFIATKFSSEFNISTLDIKPLSGDCSLREYLDWSKNMFSILLKNHEIFPYQNNKNEYVQLAMEYIQDNYKKDISRQDIAEHLKINSQYLSRIFKSLTGKTITTYITECRIEQAKILLQQGDVDLKYLYSTVGFNDYNYFFVVFKKQVGMTPIQYKNKFS